ncbi:nucleotidyltransferase domain-containing protein [Desulfurobacterium atlanticum]|uniref:Nucleotidyltransferase domain-containing protein n=1 Tax=Desulfurobacterium atlanticum TaxID=240169 RepID=A0A238XQ90_9BACT|nr:nucleotidyltransferase domain-containing protein [Desulfurobacterium atlanticum]SNR60880.1 Nucleotidyltransferase domain-containing protein [Desulfurobacterium atlanticum]
MNSNWKKIRLSEEEIKKIKETAYEVFGEEVKIYIFGSRSVPNKRGGDIDILIKSSRQISVDEKLSFLAKLELKGIERKVDLITISSGTNLKDIRKDILKTGLEI